ncbi:alpha-glucosidase [Saccharospirillum sp. HFRX-1]|uniref:glycoside hydrolase family 13 protein n=1 Tax=unclassified Saccharospirillum TaxID=2633430 RepID=UPI003712B2F5
MTEQRWWHRAVVYQIYPSSFMDANGDGMGDLPGIIQRLDHLAELGITVIWLSPIFASPMDDNGYDISDYQAIAPQFGTLDDLDRLIAEADQRGIKIILDLVVNHSSDEHPWFVDAKSSKDSDYRDFYIWRQPKADGGPPSELTSYFSGSMWEYDEASGEYYFHQFSKKQPDLNWDNPAVPEAVHAMMNWWLDRGVAGFRMDVLDLLGKDVDGQKLAAGPTLHERIHAMNRATYGPRDALTVGETWSVTPDTAPLYCAPERDEISMVFQFEHISLSFGTSEDGAPSGGKWNAKPVDPLKLKQVFAKWQHALADGKGWNSLFWNNHDLPRAVSEFGDDGEHRIRSAKMLATVLHGQQGTPYIYQGEEIGMTNVRFDAIDDYRDIETLNFYREYGELGWTPADRMAAIYRNGRDNARTPMQWSSEPNGGFSNGTPWLAVNPNYRHINVAADRADPEGIFQHYQTLIQLRKDNDVLVYGSFNLLLEDHPTVFAYERELNGERWLVLGSFSAERTQLHLPAQWQNTLCDCLIHNTSARGALGQTLDLAPYEAFMLRAQGND